MKYVVVLLAALGLVLASHAPGRADAPEGVAKWEYRLIAVMGSPPSPLLVPDANLEEAKDALEGLAAEYVKKFGYEIVKHDQFRKFLTDAGAAGWELVAIEKSAWIFKRPMK
jgi:hypothetical protein